VQALISAELKLIIMLELNKIGSWLSKNCMTLVLLNELFIETGYKVALDRIGS
jgi:hypothetical protein